MEIITEIEDVLIRHLTGEGSVFQYTPTEELAGWPGIVHGGMQLLVLCRLAEQRVPPLLVESNYTGIRKIVVRFHQPVRIDHAYIINISDVGVDEKHLSLRTAICTTQGEILTHAEFLVHLPEAVDYIFAFQQSLSAESMCSLTTIQQWPAWQSCCLNPIQKHIEVDVDWHIHPEGKGITGVVIWPEGNGQFWHAGIALALMDQGLGFCGQRDGCQMLLTIRLEAEIVQTPVCGQKLVLACHGRKLSGKTYSAHALLLGNGEFLARGNALFRIF